jgi:hypothetical protein
VTKPVQNTASAADLAPLNRIRVETALSRFPIHRLAKQGNAPIDLLRINDTGEADFKWEVSYNSKHGQPGPLAYKVDTLIVNRRIDEARRPLPEILKLGSLREICRELGFTDHNTDQIKKALLQNASAFINAKLRYKQRNGRERWGEIGYTRYSVIFTGEQLPDGRMADAVYIILNPPYRELLNQVEVRPLDYDYLVELAPGPQRLYELLSFSMYGTIAHERPRAKLIYSDYCLYAPQTRYMQFDQVKKQMYKIHVPHRDSGYITKVHYQDILDREGNPDWEMLYTPGPKAFAEYQSFARRTIAQAVPRAFIPEPQQHALPLGQTNLHDPLVAQLTARGITERKARTLLSQIKHGQEIIDQIEYTDFILSTAPPGRFHNPPGLYIRNIEDNIIPPTTFETSRKRELRQQAENDRNAQAAHIARLQAAYEDYQAGLLDNFVNNLSAEEHSQMLSDAKKRLKAKYAAMTAQQVDDLAHTVVRSEIRNTGRIDMITFEAFRAKYELV